LEKELVTVKMPANGDPNRHIQAMVKIRDQLSEMGKTLPDEEFADHILRSLPLE
jgi:hypothetical protein